MHESSIVSKDISLYESASLGDKRQREDEKTKTGVCQSRSVSKDKGKMRRETPVCVRVGACQKTKAR